MAGITRLCRQKHHFSAARLINPSEFAGFKWVSDPEEDLVPGAYLAMSKRERFGPFKNIPTPSQLRPLCSYVILQELTKPGMFAYQRITQMDL
ncbi:unnamed protein product [Cylicostephanus goldi]|uniref:Uncharacterized protein n=1 Tax=Cylicostephanus goldi TaxID=71465 RepID=A0A3P6S4D1_CYLGO|nr:unnamed protein product [Cylicostephanus goldi]